MQRIQPDPDRELLAEIERLEPLAKWEQLASGPDNPWKGKTEELEAARAALEAARTRREAETQAEEVRRYQNALERHEFVRARLAEIDAKLNALGDDIGDYFKKANERALWVNRPAGMGNLRVHGGQPIDSRGRVVDVSPLSITGRKIVPDDKWEAVKQYRDLCIQREGVGNELSIIDRSLRDLVARMPALALVQA